MIDQLFFEEDPDRLASIVGMYNIYPGMAPSTQNKVMGYFKNMMSGWLSSKDKDGKYRTAAQFAKTFIGDKPMMTGQSPDQMASASFSGEPGEVVEQEDWGDV